MGENFRPQDWEEMSTIPDRLPNPDDPVNFISGQRTDGECSLSLWH